MYRRRKAHKPLPADPWTPMRVLFPDPYDAARHLLKARGVGRAKVYVASRSISGDPYWRDVFLELLAILEPCEPPASP